jgi:hypothetical protein
MQLHSARVRRQLQTLGIKVFKGLQQLGSQRRLKQPQLVSNVDKRVITLIDALTDVVVRQDDTIPLIMCNVVV